MRKIILITIFALVFVNCFSQRQGGFRVGLDLGYTVPSSGGGGLLFSIEPKYNIQDNMNIGLRIGSAAMVRDIQTSGGNTSAKISANGSYVGTYDYYFNSSGRSFVPYIGAGIGYYSIANVDYSDLNTSNTYRIDPTGKIGELLRGGFEWGKFRMGLEYNFVPKSTLKDIRFVNFGIELELIN